ncbi:glycosyltransferase family 1 protein [Erythrobacter sp. sf7]|uniref:Glycosyltransferase family 1 protein n=1 Tax=Erythrobacter fulvus TaxID=2987523 RepID=A0ABT5JM07_9SPHN|nr:glycosyltransferase family 1 protein [Erythrobacter fulvus]MDC8753785.1 glycosyltransferase family 1 protein [Erythrobacter fulvus]
MLDNDAPRLLDVSRLVWRRWTGTRSTGIDRICLAWLDHYAAEAQAVVIHRRGKSILPRTASQALFQTLRRPDQAERDVFRFRREVLGLMLRHGIHLRDRLGGGGRLWLNPGHTGLDATGMAEWCRKRSVRPVYLVHDLIPITNPEFCRDGEYERHRRRMWTVLATGAGVVANSVHTFDTLAEFARAQGLKMPPSIAIWPGTPRLPAVCASQPDKATFVVLGTIEGRKNHRLLLSVWQDLLASASRLASQECIPELIIVGRRGWQADDVFAMLDGMDFKGSVHEVGPLDDVQLARLLGRARALLFPSLAEGYGIPLMEALAAGVPVIASDLPVFREIGQGIPELLPASDHAAWRAAILDYADPMSARREGQLRRMAAFTVHEWRNHFAELDGFLESLQPVP